MVKFYKKVVTLCGKRTSLRMSEIEWQMLENISRHANMRRNKLIELIKESKAKNLRLTPAIRLFIIVYLCNFQQFKINKIPQTEDLLKLTCYLK